MPRSYVEEVTKSLKEGYQWPHKRTHVIQKLYKEKLSNQIKSNYKKARIIYLINKDVDSTIISYRRSELH